MLFVKRLWSLSILSLLISVHGYSIDSMADIKIVDIDAGIHVDSSTAIILDSLSTLLEKYDDESRVRIAKKWKSKVEAHSNMSSYIFIPETFRRKVLLMNDEVVGVVDYFALQDNQHGYIETLAVKPNNMGIDSATQMIEHAIHDLRQMGFTTLESHIFSGDSEGKRCYESLGFTSISNQDSPGILYQNTYPVF